LYDDREFPDDWRWRAFSPHPGTVIGPVEEIPDGTAKEYRFGFGPAAFRMFVVRKDGAVHGYINSCPHSHAPLNHYPDTFFDDSGQYLLCMQHFAVFTPEDGMCVEGPCEGQKLEKLVIEVREDGQMVLL
jgi:nitrite reductase/ring-hydroxylating ferredoxin subunit